MFSTYNSIVQLTISSPTLSLYSVPLIRTPMGGSDVGSAGRPLVGQAGWSADRTHQSSGTKRR